MQEAEKVAASMLDVGASSNKKKGNQRRRKSVLLGINGVDADVTTEEITEVEQNFKRHGKQRKSKRVKGKKKASKDVEASDRE